MHKRILALLITLILLLGIVACADTQPVASTAEPVPPPVEPTETPQPDPTAEPAIVSETTGGGALLVPEGDPHETYFAPYPLTITLDGDPGDWSGVPRVLMPDDPEADTTVHFAAAADDTHICSPEPDFGKALPLTLKPLTQASLYSHLDMA